MLVVPLASATSSVEILLLACATPCLSMADEIAREIPQEASEKAAAKLLSEESGADAKPAESQQASEKKFLCGRCRTEVNEDELLQREFTNVRYCKPCHATHTALLRHGIQCDKELSEESARKFFRESRLARLGGGRIAYEKLRTMVKQTMVQETQKLYKEEKAGPFLPLSVHAKNGLDEATLKRIEQEAPMREHPLLGCTYHASPGGKHLRARDLGAERTQAHDAGKQHEEAQEDCA